MSVLSGVPHVVPHKIQINGSLATDIQLRVRGASGQSANVVEVQNSAGTTLFSVDNSGNVSLAGNITAVIDETVTGNLTLTGNLIVNGNSTLGNASSDTVTVTGTATFTPAATFTAGLTSNNLIGLGGSTAISAESHQIGRNDNNHNQYNVPLTQQHIFSTGGVATMTVASTQVAINSPLIVAGRITANGGITIGGTGSFADGTAASPSITFTNDLDTGLYRPAANQIGFTVAGAAELILSATNLQPNANDGLALGVSGTAFADLFLASGAVINFAASNYTITHASNYISTNGSIQITSNANAPAAGIGAEISFDGTQVIWRGINRTSSTSLPFHVAVSQFVLRTDDTSTVQTIMSTDSGGQGYMTFSAQAGTSGVPTVFTITGPAHTAVTAATEIIDVNVNLARNVTYAAGAGPLATQRAFLIQAPTYVGNAGGALTITDAYSVYITGAPTAGANMTLTRPWGLGVNANVGVGAGTAALPSLSFISDPNTGIYSSAADTIGFANNGLAAMTLGTNATFGYLLTLTGSSATTLLNFGTVAGAGFPRTWITGGVTAADTNYGVVYAHKNATAGDIPAFLMLSNRNDTTFAAADWMVLGSFATFAVLSSGTGVSSDGLPLYIGTDGSAFVTGTTQALQIATTANGQGVTILPTAIAGGAAAFTVTPAAHTTVIAETIDFTVGAHTITTTGAITTERFTVFGIPTITSAAALTTTTAATVAISATPNPTGAGPQTITNAFGLMLGSALATVPAYSASAATTIDAAAMLYIAGAPATGGNVTVTAGYAIWVDAGQSRFDGTILAGDKVIFTQTDGNEYIDSLADGYVDYSVTTAHRFNMSTADTDVRLEFIGTTNSGLLQWMEDEDAFRFGDDVQIDNGFGLVIGHTAQVNVTVGGATELEILGTGFGDSSATLGRWSANAFSGQVNFVKSRQTTIGSFVASIVLNDDEVGGIAAFPDDGVDYQTEAARFIMEVDDASPAAGDIGMAFVWHSMAGGGASIAEKMRLAADGTLVMSKAIAGSAFDVNYSATGYTTALGIIDVVRSGAITGVDTETMVDLNVVPSFTLTEPAGGSVNYYGANIDLSGVLVTAGVGTSVLAALRLVANADADVGTNLALFVDAGTTRLDGVLQQNDAIYFTQTDGNERIDSAADGYVDYTVTTAHRFNMSAADTDVRLEFLGTTSSGLLEWMEDEDYFRFTDSILLSGNLIGKQGSDIASASTIAIPKDGNVFELTGVTAVTLITSTGFQDGFEITLVANESVTITHGTATSGANITILLAAAGNYNMTANDTLTLVLSTTTAGGQAWREVSRAVI